MESARIDYRNASQKRQAKDSIRKAWQDIIEEPDKLLIELLLEKTETICGFRPEVGQVENFIVEVLVEKRIPHSDTISSPKRSTNVLQTTSSGTPTPPSKTGRREVTYRLFGRERTASTAKDALIEILREMAKRDQEFFEKLSRRTQSRSRNHLARTRKEVYPQRPDLAKNAIEISEGWWLGLNIANREKQRILERACEAINIVYGKDLEITFPES